MNPDREKNGRYAVTGWIVLIKTAFFFILLFPAFAAYSQSVKEFVLQNAKEIKSIDPDNSDYSDLIPLKTAIGNARVVMLGEQTHGDATAFEAKTRIIKMLHEEMDFDVLVFESDFFGMQYCNIYRDSFGFETLKSNIYGVWTECPQMQNLFEYCQKNDSLILTGCDMRHGGWYSKNNYIKNFDTLMSITKIPFYKNGYKAFRPILEEIIRNEYSSKATLSEKSLFFENMDTLSLQISKVEFSNKLFWQQELKNLKKYALSSWNNPIGTKNITDDRDQQMGENFIWLVTEMYPDKKIILWGHNMHILKNPKVGNKSTMGSYFQMNSDILSYNIGFDSYSGYFAFAGSMSKFDEKINKVKKESLEFWFHQSGFQNAFIDFTGYTENAQPFYMRGNGNIYNKLQWNKNFDGVFFIEEMKGCN